jgi:two-component system sensor kinase FixL
MTAIGFAFLAIAQLIQLRGSHVAAAALFTIPLIIGIAGSIQWLLGLSGLHTVLFGEELARIRADIPGRAPFMVLLDWGLLIAAMLLVRRQSWRSCLVACILANIPLALSIMTIALVIADTPLSEGPAYYLWASLPASLATVLLCLSVFLWCRASGGATDGEDTAGWTFVRVFPLVLLIPGLIWLFEIVALSRGASGGLLKTRALGLNMALIAAILGWAMYRMSRQQTALRTVANALDSTQVVLMHPDGTVEQWSRGCEKLFGWSAAEAVGACKYKLLETRFDDDPGDLAALPLGAELKREVTHRTRSGGELTVLEHLRRIDSGKGKPLLVAALTDVTERKAREAHLEANRTLFREVLDTMPDGVVAFDTNGIIRRFSAGAVKILGYEPAEVLGKHFTFLTVEDRRVSGTANFERFLETGIPRYLGRVTRTSVLAKGGREVQVELRAIETLAREGRVIVMFVRDLTETIAYETRLGALGNQLGHVARLSAMGEMAAGMAHELNQPLTAIVNYTGAARFLIDEGGDSIRIRELVESANEQTLRAGQIIRRMRDFGSKGQVEMEAIPVKEMIRDAAALVLIGLRPHAIELVYDLDPRAETMFGDRIQIQQVLVNLLRNAVQALDLATVEEREIRISTALRGNDAIEISVSDSGSGIPEPARADLFAPFTASGGKGGMGIGLSICRRIVEAHGGEIWAEDGEEGKGATFRFTVPS